MKPGKQALLSGRHGKGDNMKILEVCNSKMLFEENTGKWLVLEDEGYEIYKDNYQKEIIESEEIKEFIEEVNGYLNQKNLIDTKEN